MRRLSDEMEGNAFKVCPNQHKQPKKKGLDCSNDLCK